MTTFDSTKESLVYLLRNIRDGKTQLPDFQHGWVWGDEHVRSLLASVSLAYPIGALMLLQTGNTDVRFKPRPIEGVVLPNFPPDPERLVLDGQQRLTSLFQALFSGQPVATRDARGNPVQRWYYLDIPRALDPNIDREEAIIAVPEERIVRNFRGEVLIDFSTTERECEAEVLPLTLVLDIAGLMRWQMKYLQADPERSHERIVRWSKLGQEVIENFQQYQIPVILLRKETPKEAVCQVFEKVNTAGVSLTVFEILTATYAAEDYNLREDWAAREKRLKRHAVLSSLANTDLLQAVTLLASHARRLQAIADGIEPDKAPGISAKRREILRLTLADYQTWADPIIVGFERAAQFLQAHSIFTARDLPYQTQLIPLAAILAVLGDRAGQAEVQSRLARWYWCGVFGELYGSGTDTRFAKDLTEVLDWIDGGPEPETISDANFAPARLLSLRTRNSAAYKGLSALLLRDGSRDFRTGEPVDAQSYFDDRIDIYHIFPQSWCKQQGIDARRCDSFVNKTPLSSRTRRLISGSSPGIYLARIQKSAGFSVAHLDWIISSHAIDPAALRADDFDRFFIARERALLERIEQAMGRPVYLDGFEPELAESDEYESEELEV